jgi:hypothetical protein
MLLESPVEGSRDSHECSGLGTFIEGTQHLAHLTGGSEEDRIVLRNLRNQNLTLADEAHAMTYEFDR